MFEGTVHRDNLEKFADLLAEQVLTPRFADDDFTRNRQDALDYVTKTLRGNADEDLGKQAMATVMYKGHPYGYPTPGTVAGLTAITLDDVAACTRRTSRATASIVGVAGGYPDGFAEAFAAPLRGAAGQGAAAAELPPPPAHKANQLLIVEKDTRANAISIGHAARRSRASDPDFYPLTVARSYLGEHRTFNGVLMNHLRGLRGLNYGDYAYIENFIQDGWSTFPLPNIARRQQHFEIWLRPVPPQNSLFALRAALYETDKLMPRGDPAGRLRGDPHFLLNYCQPLGAGRLAPPRLRHRRRRDRQGSGQGAAGAAAQDEEGRRRQGDARSTCRCRACRSRSSPTRGRRSPTSWPAAAHPHHLRHRRHARIGGGRGRHHQALPDRNRRRSGAHRPRRPDVREMTALTWRSRRVD